MGQKRHHRCDIMGDDLIVSNPQLRAVEAGAGSAKGTRGDEKMKADSQGKSLNGLQVHAPLPS